MAALPPFTLVLGGQRSGKSAFAEKMFAGRLPALYLATAEARDAEMARRIAAHRARRGKDWETVEEPLEIAKVVAGTARPVLVECLSLWVSNLLEQNRDPVSETEALIAALRARARLAVAVSVEAGLGVVPENALARAWLDALGEANRRLAAAADRVVLVTAGLPLVLKGTP
ncbi:MAG: bifunctional adenosylcobinamide kinase/adenosylcobinamide-phosphate guanylyltransferase [Rhodospirillales bacterium]|nr:bifunctional adenosylcobinamide kinase/adenosylcobinamide-phosphate guanylyltransferase [Rhodospirillales bacterium]